MKLRHRRHRGVGLIEVMIALSISASVLVSVAVSLNASIQGYKVNVEQSSLYHQGRLALNRMLTTIRVNQLHAPESSTLSTQFAAGTIVTDTGLRMYDANNVLITYHYDSVNKRLQVITGGSTYTMLDGVDAFQVTLEPMRSPESIRTGAAYDLLQRATISLTLRTAVGTAVGEETTGKQTITLSSAVAPRRNCW